MRGVEQIPWLYDAGMVLLEKTGLGRWRSWLAGGVPRGSRTRPRLRHRPQPPALRRRRARGRPRPLPRVAPEGAPPRPRRAARSCPRRGAALPRRRLRHRGERPRLLQRRRRAARPRRGAARPAGRRRPAHARARPRARPRRRLAAGPHAAGLDVVHRRLPPEPRHRGRGRRRRVRRRPGQLPGPGRHAALRESPERATIRVGRARDLEGLSRRPFSEQPSPEPWPLPDGVERIGVGGLATTRSSGLTGAGPATDH